MKSDTIADVMLIPQDHVWQGPLHRCPLLAAFLEIICGLYVLDNSRQAFWYEFVENTELPE
jgi:hypothetical protein